MNRPFTIEDVRGLLAVGRDPIDGLVEMEFEWRLGMVMISKVEPLFRVGYPAHLKPDSRFYKLPFNVDGRIGIALVLQVFDPRSTNPDRPEWFAGWVPVDRERDADRWIELLNGEIAARLAAGSGTARPSTSQAATTAKERPEKKLIPLAYKELGYTNDPSALSLLDVRGKRRAGHKAEVLEYLKRGRTIAYAVGIAKDIFDPSKLAESLSSLTDETYKWPEVLAYYVEHYDVALPDVFEDHMRSKGWKHW